MDAAPVPTSPRLGKQNANAGRPRPCRRLPIALAKRSLRPPGTMRASRHCASSLAASFERYGALASSLMTFVGQVFDGVGGSFHLRHGAAPRVDSVS